MGDRLYELMDWARIEGLVYSEEDHPHDFLGAHVTSSGVLVQLFLPTAAGAEVILEGAEGESRFPMTMEDEAGFFAALLPVYSVPAYHYEVCFDDGTKACMEDPYRFLPPADSGTYRAFQAGIDYRIYEKLGSHRMTIDGTEGVYFAVWAPNAMRVSLVGDFNLWDGRRMPMRRLKESGVFDLFVPGIKADTIYKYEIKARGGLTFLKSDPFAYSYEVRPNTASLVSDLSGFEWTDDRYRERREEAALNGFDDHLAEPSFTCEIHPGTFRRPDDGREFYNYRELAPMIADYVQEMGFTQIELMPVMEYPHDESMGYQTTGYYAPTSRFGSPKDFMYFVNYMHSRQIPVILDWTPADFAADIHGLCGFDGTCLYEHQDPRQGMSPATGNRIYNYARPQVSNFLIANALFWAKVYHIDGLRAVNTASMLYLDYDRSDGQWIPNMFGGNENLDAVDFLRLFTTVCKKEAPGTVLIAQDTSSWPLVTAPVQEKGLGFDYKWDTGWTQDFLNYMQLDPIFRGPHHGELQFSMIYHYSENFLLAVSHEETGREKGSLISRVPGRMEMKHANLRAAYGYLTAHPGKKLLFMGQELCQPRSWDPEAALEWDAAGREECVRMKTYLKDLLKLYKSCPALYEKDYDADGFEWINNISANENMLVFLRKGRREEDELLIVLNFSSLPYEKHKIGVPFRGSYKEIFNSDAEAYGGRGNVNPRAKVSRTDECDGRPDSIRITVPPMGISIWKCTRSSVKEIPEEEAQQGAETAQAKKPAAKKKAAAASKSAKPAADRRKSSIRKVLEQKFEEEE